MTSSQSSAERTHALILEIELPDFYADDLPKFIAEYGDPDEPEGDQILRDIGHVSYGLLTVEVAGEKDSDIVRTPVLMVGARVEERPPASTDFMKHFVEKLDEPREIERVSLKIADAHVRIYERLLRQLAGEYTGQVSDLAKQALQEARLAEDEIERQEWPDAA